MLPPFRLFWLIPLIGLVGGSIVYCAMVILAALNYKKSGATLAREFPSVSILRPLAGDRDNTAAGLRSVFTQDYPDFEVILGVADPEDAAVPIARRVMAEYPDRTSRLIFTGESPHPNRKVWQLRGLWDEARHETIVMVDSDIRWERDCLKTVVSELAQDGVGLVTCPYRAVAGPSLWSQAEALGLNVDFISGMLAARMLRGMDYAIGCTIALRRADMAAIGGLREMQPYLSSEDFVMGNRMHKSGRTVVLSQSVVEHYIGSDSLRNNWRHRLRWARATRRSRPAGYPGEIFTRPAVPALALWVLAPGWGPLAALALLMRLIVILTADLGILHDPELKRRWWLFPVTDASLFAGWVLGFFGNTMTWRGHRFVIERDGTCRENEPISSGLQ